MKMLTLILVISCSLCAFAGDQGGGGGTSVLFNNARIFLDLLMLPKMRNVVQNANYDCLDPQVCAKQILKNWSQKSLSIGSEWAEKAFHENIQWEIIDKEFPLSTKYYLPPNLDISDPKTVAYYTYKQGERKIQISKPSFNELSDLSKVTLIVHESLRNVQIGMNGYSNEQDGFSERNLQEATAIYVLCSPSQTLGMYANFLLNDQRDQAESLYGDTTKLIEKHCRSSL